MFKHYRRVFHTYHALLQEHCTLVTSFTLSMAGKQEDHILTQLLDIWCVCVYMQYYYCVHVYGGPCIYIQPFQMLYFSMSHAWSQLTNDLILLLQQRLTGTIEMLIGTTQPERAPARRNAVNIT